MVDSFYWVYKLQTAKEERELVEKGSL